MATLRTRDFTCPATVDTANATPLQVASYATPSGCVIACELRVLGRDTAGNRAITKFSFGGQNIAGVLTLGTITTISTDLNAALATSLIVITFSGASIIVTATGVAATTITWLCEFNVLQH